MTGAMETVPVRETSPLCDAVRALYESAFPENERQDFGTVLRDAAANDLDLLAFTREGMLCGMAVLLRSGDISHIIYLAVAEKMRGQGIGSGILALLREREAGQRIIADLERDVPGAPNSAQRRMRRRFYERAGYEACPVRYDWQGDSYEILSNGGSVSAKEFGAFWRELSGHMDVSGY